MQADTLKDGLNLLKKQSEAMIEKIKNCSITGDGSLKNRILEDFDKALQKGGDMTKQQVKAANQG